MLADLPALMFVHDMSVDLTYACTSVKSSRD